MFSTAHRDAIDVAADSIDGELVELRREIHHNPELAGNEHRTSELVLAELRAAGVPVEGGIGGYGVVAEVEGAHDGPTIAYRADLDAVAVDEGAAHICGHDLHTAIGVGIVRVLAGMRERLHGRVVFVFQPAEETLEGARAMLADGVLERYAPEEIYALHCGPLPVGQFAVMPGFGQPGQDLFQIELSGPDAAEEAEKLAQLIGGLSTVRVPQSPEERAKLDADLTTPNGPLASFVFAQAVVEPREGGAVVDAWVRAWPDSRYAEVREEVQRAAARARIRFPGEPFPAMVCDPELSRAAGTYLRWLLGVGAVTELHAAFPFNGEDFALFLQRVPGAMFFLGVANEERGLNGVPHHPSFGADERAIGVGVRGMAGFLLSRA